MQKNLGFTGVMILTASLLACAPAPSQPTPEATQIPSTITMPDTHSTMTEPVAPTVAVTPTPPSEPNLPTTVTPPTEPIPPATEPTPSIPTESKPPIIEPTVPTLPTTPTPPNEPVVMPPNPPITALPVTPTPATPEPTPPTPELISPTPPTPATPTTTPEPTTPTPPTPPAVSSTPVNVLPVSYTATPGERGYPDDTGKQLIDTVLGGDIFNAKITGTAALEWVGWSNKDASFSFVFAKEQKFSKIRIGFNHNETAGILLPKTVTINDQVFPLKGNEVGNLKRGFVTFDVNFNATNITIKLERNPSRQWMMVDEVRFEAR